MTDLVNYYYEMLEIKRGESSMRDFLINDCGLVISEVSSFFKSRKRKILPVGKVLVKTLVEFDDDTSVKLVESSVRDKEKVSPQTEQAYEEFYKNNPQLIPIRRNIRKLRRQLIMEEIWRKQNEIS